VSISEREFRSAIRLIAEAPYDPRLWTEALALIARAGGGWAGQLVGIAGGVPTFNVTSGFTDEANAKLEAYGGYDPARNPRMAIAFRRPSPRVFGEDEFSTEAYRRSSPLFQEVFRAFDACFGAYAKMPARGAAGAVLTVARSQRQGPAQRGDLDRLERLLPHIEASVRLQIAIEAQGAAMAAGVLGAVSIAAFFCDASGRLIAATPAGDAALATARHLRVRRGRLEACDRASDAELQAGLRRALGRDLSPALSPIAMAVLRASEGRPAVADIAPVPAPPNSFRSGAVAMISLGASRPRSDARGLLRRAYGFTAAEAAVAESVARGERLGRIAERRGASIETVRNQLKAAFAKAGVESQIELAAAVHRLVGAASGR